MEKRARHKKSELGKFMSYYTSSFFFRSGIVEQNEQAQARNQYWGNRGSCLEKTFPSLIRNLNRKINYFTIAHVYGSKPRQRYPKV